MNVFARKFAANSKMAPAKTFIALFSAFLSCWPTSCALASNEIISRDGAIESVKVGDSAKKIFLTFKSLYHVSDVTKPQHVRTISLSKDRKTIATFFIDGEGRILLIEIRSIYKTIESIGLGSTLDQAIGVYGSSNVTPTDGGYLVTFKKISNISFLLNNDDIPKDLRNIPDDVFTLDDEKRILGLGKARIAAIQISSE